MKLIPFLVATMAASFATMPSYAYFKDGNQIYSTCTAPMGTADYSVCQGYLAGIADAMERERIAGSVACIPTGVTIGQLKDVANQYLRTNPAIRHLEASGLLAHAFAAAFPCR